MTDELHPALDVDDLGRVSLGVVGDQQEIAGTSRAALEGASCGSPCHGPALELRYHVPRSQVWAGSRGGQSGNVHLHVLGPLEVGRLRRSRGRALCGRDGWYERSLETYELERLPVGACARCLELADRYGLDRPAWLEGTA